jgi:hypothetical protein
MGGRLVLYTSSEAMKKMFVNDEHSNLFCQVVINGGKEV